MQKAVDKFKAELSSIENFNNLFIPLSENLLILAQLQTHYLMAVHLI